MRLLGTPALFQGLRCDSKTPSVVKKEQVSAADDIFDTLVVNDDFCFSFFFFSISSLSYNLFGHFLSSLHAVVYVTKLPTHSYICNTPVTGIHVPYGLWLFLSCIWADTDYCSILLKQGHICLHTARLHTC